MYVWVIVMGYIVMYIYMCRLWYRHVHMYVCMCGLGISSCGYRHGTYYVWVMVIVMYICMCGLGLSSCTYVCVG